MRFKNGDVWCFTGTKNVYNIHIGRTVLLNVLVMHEHNITQLYWFKDNLYSYYALPIYIRMCLCNSTTTTLVSLVTC